MLIGSAFDTFLLEPEEFDTNYRFMRGSKPKSAQAAIFCSMVSEGHTAEVAQSAAYAKADAKKAAEMLEEFGEYIEALSQEVTLLDSYMEDKFIAMNQAMLRNPMYQKLLNSKALFQDALYGEIGGIEVKGLADIIVLEDDELFVYDLKTTSLPISEWKTEAVKRRYPHQLLWYGELARQNYNRFYTPECKKVTAGIFVVTTGDNPESRTVSFEGNVFANASMEIAKLVNLYHYYSLMGFEQSYEEANFNWEIVTDDPTGTYGRGLVAPTSDYIEKLRNDPVLQESIRRQEKPLGGAAIAKYVSSFTNNPF